MRGLLHSPLDSPGLLPYGLPTVEYGASPAAATDFVYTPDANYFTRVLAVFVLLTPDANVADRTVSIQFRDYADRVLVTDGAPVTVPASDVTSFSFTAFRSENVWEVDSTVLCALSPILLTQQMDMRIHVTNAQAGDTLTAIRLIAQRYYSDVELPGLG